MDQIEQFRSILSQLIEFAKTKDNRMTKEEVESYFRGWPLSKEQWDLINGYLELNKIEIKKEDSASHINTIFAGGEDSENESLPFEEEESKHAKQNIKLYKEELSQLEQLSAEEIQILLNRHLQKDRQSTNKLIEYYLPFVAAIAAEYEDQDIDQGDLTQEGNMALISAVSSYREGEFKEHIRSAVDLAMKSFIEQQTGVFHVDQYVANQVNLLMDVSSELAETLGREANLTELAERMKLPKETIEALMRISLEAVSVAEAHGGDSPESDEEEHFHHHHLHHCDHDH